jgi:hypothetical protein
MLVSPEASMEGRMPAEKITRHILGAEVGQGGAMRFIFYCPHTQAQDAHLYSPREAEEFLLDLLEQVRAARSG